MSLSGTYFLALIWLFAGAMAQTPLTADSAIDEEKTSAASESPAAPEVVSFQDQIQPILSKHCSQCHAAEKRKGDLDLSSLEGINQGGESGSVISPGKPKASLLLEKIVEGEMPPDDEQRLDDQEIELIRRWIEQGASQEKPLLTQHDVIPILLRRCTSCHGRYRKEGGGLDLRTPASILKGGQSGPAIVPGKPEESLLITRIKTEEMPPRDRLVEASIKVIEPAEVETLVRWIEGGAPVVDVVPDVATTEPDPLVTDEDRAFWAFQPPKQFEPPEVRNLSLIRQPIDRFILKKLEERGLSFSPEADRATLIRRASYDLTGLPPEPEEVQKFLKDEDPRAYENLIERLLNSPRYGERWGRYWLDLAGYADSEGKREQDHPRQHAWRYRDYVIRSINNDKPYDRFLLEQIAGDELVDYEHAPEITQEIYDNLVATGFLKMAPDGTWANITNYVPDRLDVVSDEIDILGSGVMGLTMKCARCHSHKFDPIPHRDYYRLVDIFKGAFDEYNWIKPDIRAGAPLSVDTNTARMLNYVTTTERKAWEAENARIDQEIEAAKGRPDAEQAIQTLQGQRKPEPRIHALWDQGNPSPTYLYRRGDPMLPGKLVGPGVPSVLTDGKTPFVIAPPWPGTEKTGRRLAFARWLTNLDHPLTSRVMVNRIWKLHFGQGIVKTLGNFGKTGTPPTHPELLDWLARDFVRKGWSLKAMHRLIMTSRTYRQSSRIDHNLEQTDPENLFYSRMPLIRLDAEGLYDSQLLVAGSLDETRFGPGDPVTVRPDGLVTPNGTTAGWRRLIYVLQNRKSLPTHLETFDFPQMNPNCLERRESVVATQALHLMNNGMVHELSLRFAARVKRSVGASASPKELIEQASWIALSRPPSDAKLNLGITALNELISAWETKLPESERSLALDKALATYCHALLNSAAFLYVD